MKTHIEFGEPANLGPGKFIRMPKADLEQWLKVLRAPENQDKQGTGRLFGKNEPGIDVDGYCCLGVAQWSRSGRVERNASFPSGKWLNHVGWTFADAEGYKTTNPWLLVDEASALNDSKKYPFRIIADLIQLVTETY